MRILQFSPHYVPAYRFGGVLQVAHSLATTLQAQGHDVRVITTNLADPQHTLAVPVDRPTLVDGIRVFYEPVVLSRYWGLSPLMARRAWAESQTADIVLVHFHYQYASMLGSLVARLRHRPYIIFVHGSLSRFGVQRRSTRLKQLYLRLLEQSNFRHALFTAYCSEEEMANSLRLGHGRVVPNGIDPKVFSPAPPSGSFRRSHPQLGGRTVYLFMGRLVAGKGLDLLLPAFRSLLGRGIDGHLVIAGGDERGYERTVQQMIAGLGLGDRVTLTGLIGGQDRLGALSDADVYVLPSLSEGLSMAMLEAMYMRLPVIATDRVGLWRQIQETGSGLIVRPEVAALEQAMAEMTNDDRRQAMGRAGHDLVAGHYTWDRITRDLVTQVGELTGLC